ncbi:interleukin-1 beta [Polypterus senegalus]|uniref:interleukin-1 beta n=1 Tax=Polypterus senegalus TaxID=55291 RepID=UPI00196365A0|nr:interleukin-1 beta [Polypterus senegalus]
MAYESSSSECLSMMQTNTTHFDLDLECPFKSQIKYTTMQQLVSLVITVGKLKSYRRMITKPFSDTDLVSFLVDQDIIEEKVVQEVTSSNPFESESIFSQTQSNILHSIRDLEQKCWVLRQFSNHSDLIAVTLQGPNLKREVKLNLSTYRLVNPSKMQPVILGISGTKLYLSCAKSADTPVLQLEEVDDSSQLQTIDSDSDMVRFLFYKQESGSTTQFESALCESWYISTDFDERKEVTLCHMENQVQERNTRFLLFR